ncbi:unnamed protein product [Aphanomyces euteiches]
MISILILSTLLTTVAAIGCTPDQKQQMLDAIVKNPKWTACQQATAPFDFYAALTQTGAAATANDIERFTAAPACTTVYDSFQDSLKQANCDEVRDLAGLSVDKLLGVASASASPTSRIPVPATTPVELSTKTEPLEPTMTTSLASGSASVAIITMSSALAMLLF